METHETPAAAQGPARGGYSRAAGVKVFCLYFAYWTLFTVVAAVMLALLTAALCGVPAGIMLGVFGVATLAFKADFIITELSGQLMLFGGLAGACACACAGLLAVKAGFVTARLFLRVKRRCDRLRGW